MQKIVLRNIFINSWLIQCLVKIVQNKRKQRKIQFSANKKTINILTSSGGFNGVKFI